MDGVSSNQDLITIAATNKYDRLDDALKSRFVHKIPFTRPDRVQREKIFEKQLSYYNNKLDSIDFLIDPTENFDARAIKNIFSKAAKNALLNDRSYLLKKDFGGLI